MAAAFVTTGGAFVLFPSRGDRSASALACPLLRTGSVTSLVQQQTHHYDLADSALAQAAQRYDWAQEGKGNRAELEKLVADDYVLFRAGGKVTNKAGLIALVCEPGSYTNPYIVETPFVRDLGDTVILGGWVNLSGSENGKSFQQKARFADIWHKSPKGWQLTFTQVTLADHP